MTSSGVFTPLPERAFFVDASIPHKRCTYRHFSVFWGVGFRLFPHKCYKSDFSHVHKSDLGHPSYKKIAKAKSPRPLRHCSAMPPPPKWEASLGSPFERLPPAGGRCRMSDKGRMSCRAEARLRGHCQNEPPCAERTTAHFFIYPLASRCSSAGVMPNSRLYWAEKWLKLLYPSCTATLLTVRLVVRSSRRASSSFCWMT